MSNFTRKIKRNNIRNKYGNRLVKPIKELTILYIQVEKYKDDKINKDRVKVLQEKMQYLNNEIEKYINKKKENIKRMKEMYENG